MEGQVKWEGGSNTPGVIMAHALLVKTLWRCYLLFRRRLSMLIIWGCVLSQLNSMDHCFITQ